MNPLAIIGGGVKTLAGLFGGNDEGERTERKSVLMRVLSKIRGEARGEAIKTNAGYLANARAAAAKRAGAQGRSAEASILPTERSAMKAGAENLRATDAPFRMEEFGIEKDFANRPIEPSFGERLVGTLGEAGGALADYGMDKDFLETQGEGGSFFEKGSDYLPNKRIRDRVMRRNFSGEQDEYNTFLGQ
jgi:hypothetical protein